MIGTKFLYCLKHHTTKKFKPFCVKCWKDINNEKCDTKTEYYLEKSILNKYKKIIYD